MTKTQYELGTPNERGVSKGHQGEIAVLEITANGRHESYSLVEWITVDGYDFYSLIDVLADRGYVDADARWDEDDETDGDSNFGTFIRLPLKETA